MRSQNASLVFALIELFFGGRVYFICSYLGMAFPPLEESFCGASFYFSYIDKTDGFPQC